MLRGSKVILREKRISDSVNDYAWRCDAELCQLDGAYPWSLSFAEFLASYTEDLRSTNSRQYHFAIESLDGKHIGNCGCYNIDEEKGEAEIGIMIGEREYWDKDYGTDVISALVNHILESTQLKRLYLHTLDWNSRAQRCFEKCGFVPCGHVTRVGNHFIAMELRWDAINEELKQGRKGC